MKYFAPLLVSAALLAACGGNDVNETVPEGAITKVETEISSAQNDAKAPERTAKAKAVEPDDHYVSMARMKAFSVFDLTLDMPQSDAFAALQAQGFTAPTNLNSRFECSHNQWKPCSVKIGTKQKSVYPFTRGEYQDSTIRRYAEEVYPFFYTDSDGALRLYQVKYKRIFTEPTYPRQLTPQLIEKYGEPTERKVDTDVKTDYRYAMRIEAPQEFYEDPAPELRPQDQGNTTEAIYNRVQAQRQGYYRKPHMESRMDCQMARLRDIDAAPSKRCAQILSYAFKDSPFYFSNVRQPIVLNIKIDSPDSSYSTRNALEVTLTAPLASVVTAAYIEEQILKSINEATSKPAGSISGLDDL